MWTTKIWWSLSINLNILHSLLYLTMLYLRSKMCCVRPSNFSHFYGCLRIAEKLLEIVRIDTFFIPIFFHFIYLPKLIGITGQSKSIFSFMGVKTEGVFGRTMPMPIVPSGSLMMLPNFWIPRWVFIGQPHFHILILFCKVLGSLILLRGWFHESNEILPKNFFFEQSQNKWLVFEFTFGSIMENSVL